MVTTEAGLKKGGMTVRVLAGRRPVPVLELVPKAPSPTGVQPHHVHPGFHELHKPAPRRVEKHHLKQVSRFLIVLAILQILDLASTLVAVSSGATEANPLAAWTLRQGVPAFIALKLLLAAAVVAVIPFLERERRPLRAATWTTFGFDLAFAGVVGANFGQVLLFA